MQDILDQKDRFAQEKALLVAVYDDSAQEDHCEEMLDELSELVQTNGGTIAGRMAVKIREPNARLLVGSGKADEIVAGCRELDANMIIFDEILSPAQQRNWEKLAKIQVIDRQEVILSIFAQRASTKEAELQIELARSEYLLPRLKNAWTHLHRQRGGVGVRGGEGFECDGGGGLS